MVVVLHGCLEDGPTIADSSQHNSLAAQRGFFVAYPEQDPLANASRCWNWFLPADQTRGIGEPAIIAAIAREVMAAHAIDSRRVFVVGISAGAAMSMVLGVTYPDLFAAAGPVAGCGYMDDACENLAPPALPATLGALAYSAMGTYARVVPVIAFQGDADMVVAPTNVERLVHQWLTTDDLADDGIANGSVPQNPLSTTQGTAPAGHAYSVDHYVDRGGQPLSERWLITGLVHAWPGELPASSSPIPWGRLPRQSPTDSFRSTLCRLERRRRNAPKTIINIALSSCESALVCRDCKRGGVRPIHRPPHRGAALERGDQDDESIGATEVGRMLGCAWSVGADRAHRRDDARVECR